MARVNEVKNDNVSFTSHMRINKRALRRKGMEYLIEPAMQVAEELRHDGKNDRYILGPIKNVYTHGIIGRIVNFLCFKPNYRLSTPDNYAIMKTKNPFKFSNPTSRDFWLKRNVIGLEDYNEGHAYGFLSEMRAAIEKLRTMNS